jgi:hypothetical protein
VGVGQEDRVPQTTRGEFLGYFNASHVAKYTKFLIVYRLERLAVPGVFDS